MEKIIKLNDIHTVNDILNNDPTIFERISGKPKRTLITITDHDTGKILGTYENKVVITGSIFTAEKVFGIKSPITLPSYKMML